MAETPPPGDTLQDIVGFKYPLPNLARSLKQRNTKIVAFGSSSTAGTRLVVPYPAYLELMLRNEFGTEMTSEFGKRMINVINRGVGGEEASTELPRMQSDVIDEAPALVIWQVGTNAVFRNTVPEFAFEKVFAAIAEGLDRLARIPADVILMDSQYTTAVVEKPEKKELSDTMVKGVSELAKAAGVDVFRRYALMEHWQKTIAMRELIDPADDLVLHLSDWATRNVTEALFNQIKKMVKAAEVT
ncbi:acyl-CoA thioesterase-1 [Bradyrhizobium sp. AZCC 2262]|uniref:SGNH/GDSL hydrolase family protein n=1 Tax=Bradyrhizobium sp. AZCC 2262 TaxID=3117022 RepID=UPI002FEE726B